MPRGQYDRSKTKAQRAAEKAAAASGDKQPKAKRAYHRKAAAATVEFDHSPKLAARKYTPTSSGNIQPAAEKLAQMQSYFNVLISARNEELLAKEEISTALNKTLSRMETLAEQIQPHQSEVATGYDVDDGEETVEEKAEKRHSTKAAKAVPAPAAIAAPVPVPAPVPFPTPASAPFNGAQ